MSSRINSLAAGVLCGLFVAGAPAGARAETPRVVLVTGFEPFGGDQSNGSWEAVQALNGKQMGGYEIVVAQLPVVWGTAEEKLHQLVKQNSPAAVVCFGQAGEEPVRLESTAHNVRERILDNRGMMPPFLKVDADSPPMLGTSLPLETIKSRLEAANIPMRVSHDAGTYLCNDTFYTLMYDPGTEEAKKIPRGFVHVPPLDGKVATDNGATVVFDRKLLQKTAEIVVQSVVDALPKAPR